MEEKEQIRAAGIIRKLIKVDKFHKAVIDAKIQKLGIHRSQHNILMYLYFSEGTNNQEDIANKLEISPAAVAVSLKKLESSGLVERATRSDNSRAKDVMLTDEGREIVQITRETFMSADEVLTRGFQPEELDRLEEYLDRMAANLKNEAPELKEIKFPGPDPAAPER